MAIANTDIKFFKSTSVNNTTTNGGKISANRVTTNTLNNLFPNVTSAERTAGVTRYRKVFMKNENSSDIVLETTKLYIGMLSSGEDYFRMVEGTDSDIQSDADDYTNWFGSGILNTNLLSGESSMEVAYDTNDGVFSGESILLRLDDGTNNAEVQLVGSPSWLGNIATLSFSGALEADFDADDTVVSTVVELGEVKPESSSWLESSSAGTYDESTYPLVLFNIGTISEDWTLTFTSSTAFSVTGAVTGSIGSGTIGTNFMPANGVSYYFKIDKSGWGGTWATGNTITFTTKHAAKPLWIKEVVPAGCSALSNNSVRLNWEGESA